MSVLSGGVQIFATDIDSNSVTQLHPLGTLGLTKDGRKYRYGKAGGSDLDPGKLTVAATQEAQHANQSVQSDAAVGDKQVSLTLGSASVSANEYADGYLVINDEAGEGIAYLISGHPSAESGATLVVKLNQPISVALTTVSEYSLVKNPWRDAVISVADQADLPVGIPNVTITTLFYGWFQTGGVCSAWADETITAGEAITIGDTTVGQIGGLDAAGEPDIGYALQAAAVDEYRAVYLRID